MKYVRKRTLEFYGTTRDVICYYVQPGNAVVFPAGIEST